MFSAKHRPVLNSFEGYVNELQMAWRVSPAWWSSTTFACLHVIRVRFDILKNCWQKGQS